MIDDATNGPRRDGGTRRVLVVDDHDDITELMVEVLSDAGHDVRAVGTGAAALAAAEEHAPEVVLLDLGLPDMDGCDVARWFRARAWASGVTLIAYSGYSDTTRRRRALDAGFDHFFVKPVAFEALLEAISRAG